MFEIIEKIIKICIIIQILFVNSLLADIDNGIVAHFPFDGSANDISINSVETTEFGELIYSEGIQGQAVILDGIDDWIKIQENSNLSFNKNNFSISCWFKTESGGFILDERVLYEIGYYIILQGESTVSFGIQDYNNGNAVSKDEINVKDNKWHLVTCVRNDEQVLLYLDGKLLSEDNNKFLDVGDSHPIFVGRRFNITNPDAYPYFKGKIDELRIYNRSLTEVDIQELYDLYVTEIDCDEIVQNSIAELSQEFTSLSKTYSELSSNYKLLSSSFIQTHTENKELKVVIGDLEQTISEMYTKEQLNEAVGQKELLISQLNASIASMFTQSQLDQAIAEAREGLYTSESVNLMINKLLEWDLNNDGTIGIVEAIQALKISTGIKPIE